MANPRIGEYEAQHQCRLPGLLSPWPGQDGFVMRSDRHTAVKFFDRSDRFHRELQVYQVLASKEIRQVAGHNVPILHDFDEALLAIEIQIVERPFVLDFAGAKLPHEVPDFEQHVIDEHIEHLQELFDDRWSDAMHVA
jgi:hypothetical protein